MMEGRTQFLLFFFLPSAAKDGGITKIYYVDYECKSVMGLYSIYTVLVYRE